MTSKGPTRFSWMLPGRLAGSGRPGRSQPLEEDLAFLRREGITAIISLLESTLNLEVYREEGFEEYHYPAEDFSAPSIEQVASACELIESLLLEGKRVLVHCNAGIGRTGALLACFLVHQGTPPEEAIRRIRRERPLSLETEEQAEVVRRYHLSRKGGKTT